MHLDRKKNVFNFLLFSRFSEQERLAASQSEVERLRVSNSELLQEMETCREREAELLEFTQKLTEKKCHVAVGIQCNRSQSAADRNRTQFMQSK